MSLHPSFITAYQCFVSVANVPFYPLLPFSSLSPLSSESLLLKPGAGSHKHIHTSTPAHTHTHTHTLAHTPVACHLFGTVISSSLVVSTPSFSAFNSLFYPPFSCSLSRRSWPHLTELNIQLCLPECKCWNVIKLWIFIRSLCCGDWKQNTNTTLTQPWLFTESSMQTQPQKCLHTNACTHAAGMRARSHRHTYTQLHWKI